jgi:hypothetical protein
MHPENEEFPLERGMKASMRLSKRLDFDAESGSLIGPIDELI